MRSTVVARILAAGTLGAGLVLTSAGAVGAADLTEPKVTTADGKQVIEVHAVATGEQFVPKGGGPTDDFPEDEDFEPEMGDAFTFTEDLSQDGVLVGTDSGTCTIVSASTSTCDVTVTFPRGTLRLMDTLTFDESDEEGAPFTVALVSGTGAYAGAKGSGRVVDNEDESSDITLTFATAGQVSEVPAGGADTGGGAVRSNDTALVLVLGAAVVAAGAGLIGAGLTAGRRS